MAPPSAGKEKSRAGRILGAALALFQRQPRGKAAAMLLHGNQERKQNSG
jgi:hypothetical protein